MASERRSFHEEESMKPLCGWEEGKAEPGRSRAGRRSNGKGPKKPSQRGMGVAKLEWLREQESLKKVAEASGVPSLHDQHHHLHLLQCQCHPPMFGSGSVVPARYGAPSPSHAHGVFQCPQHNSTIFGSGQGPFIGNKGGLSVLGGGACSSVPAGWLVPNQHNNMVGPYGSGPPLFSPPVRNPLETSKELSSMPNVHSDCFDLCLKKTRFNEDNVKGSNARIDRAVEAYRSSVHDFLGFVPQPPATSDFHNTMTCRHDIAASAYATPNLDEVVAVHRRGNSVSGRVFMEYEFFPGKDGRGTTSKELELPTIGSVVPVGGEASSITVTAYGDTPSNSLDLSLKL